MLSIFSPLNVYMLSASYICYDENKESTPPDAFYFLPYSMRGLFSLPLKEKTICLIRLRSLAAAHEMNLKSRYRYWYKYLFPPACVLRRCIRDNNSGVWQGKVNPICLRIMQGQTPYRTFAVSLISKPAARGPWAHNDSLH